jgi:hypothetical protein
MPLSGADEVAPGAPFAKKVPAACPPENVVSASVTVHDGGGDAVKSEVWRVI